MRRLISGPVCGKSCVQGARSRGADTQRARRRSRRNLLGQDVEHTKNNSLWSRPEAPGARRPSGPRGSPGAPVAHKLKAREGQDLRRLTNNRRSFVLAEIHLNADPGQQIVPWARLPRVTQRHCVMRLITQGRRHPAAPPRPPGSGAPWCARSPPRAWRGRVDLNQVGLKISVAQLPTAADVSHVVVAELVVERDIDEVGFATDVSSAPSPPVQSSHSVS
jgi:hypothetical protein